MNQATESKHSVSFRCGAYLKLFRIPNVFTALADVLMGFLVIHQQLTPLGPLVCLLIASACIYTAGMVLNDVYDIEVDRLQRPQRPLPAGDISWAHARRLGFGLLIVGVLVATATGLWGDSSSVAWRSGLIALLLALCVLFYDRVFKKTAVAPLLMGGCRFFNVLLGMSFVTALSEVSGWGYAPHQWMIAGGLGCYIAGVTWFARTEARVSSRWQLAAAVFVMAAGILLLARYPMVLSESQRQNLLQLPADIVFLLFGVLGLTIIYRCLIAVCDPVPGRVQMAVKHCLQSLIILDAAVAASVAKSRPEAFLVLLLLFPMVVLGRWFRST